MKKPRSQPGDSTLVALAVAVLCGATALYCSEVIYGNIADSGSRRAALAPSWRGHMLAGCIGAAVLVLSLFLLERIGGRSKSHALRCVIPWLPLVAVTGLASIIHISSYLVVLAIVVYSPWAYRNMRRHAGSNRS